MRAFMPKSILRRVIKTPLFATNVRRGLVLSGIVFSGSDLRDAIRIASKAAGNRPVVDDLTVEHGE